MTKRILCGMIAGLALLSTQPVPAQTVPPAPAEGEPIIVGRIGFAEKTADPLRWWGHCLLMKPGPQPAAGNLQQGRP